MYPSPHSILPQNAKALRSRLLLLPWSWNQACSISRWTCHAGYTTWPGCSHRVVTTSSRLIQLEVRSHLMIHDQAYCQYILCILRKDMIFMLIRSRIWTTGCWSHVFFNNWTENISTNFKQPWATYGWQSPQCLALQIHMALLCSFANSFYHRFRWNTGPVKT